MRIAIDADDAAVNLKEIIYKHLLSKDYDVTDIAFSKDGTALYPEIGYNLAQRIRQKDFDRGILICGTGIGMAMVANKVQGVYAGLCHDVFSAQRLAKSNDGNILTMGERVIGSELAKLVVEAWLSSLFEGGSSEPKVIQMRNLESKSFSSLK